MADNPTKAFELSSDGIAMSDESGNQKFWLGAGSLDPSITGIDAPLGSRYQNPDGTEWVKIGVSSTNWIKNFVSIFEGITPPLVLSHNGTLSNGQLIGYTNLANNPVVVGFKCKVVKVTYVNSRTDSDANFRFYKDTQIPANLFHTMSFTNTYSTVANVTTSPTFNIGDLCRIYFDDTGDNPNDMNMGVFFEAIP